MEKYNIDRDFKKLKLMTFPIAEEFAPVAEKVLGTFVLSAHSDADVDIAKYDVPVNGGSIKCLLYSPADSHGVLPLVVYFHGGGFIYKAAPYHYRLIKDYCCNANCRILAVDYRNPPKYRYPIPFEDCYAALKWAIGNADLLGVDADNTVVSGDSAGGCLAVSAVLKARDENIKSIRAAMLVYPVTDRRMTSQSMVKYTDTPVWNSQLNKKMWKLYLSPDNRYENDTTGYIAPLDNDDFVGFPKTYIECAEFDCLHDDSINLARLLKNCGCDVTLFETKGTVHGFEMVYSSEITKKSIQRRIEFLKEVFSKAEREG